jgi:hypothetical protein
VETVSATGPPDMQAGNCGGPCVAPSWAMNGARVRGPDPNNDGGLGSMPTYQDTSVRCDDCGVEIPVAAIAGPDGTVALTVEDYLHLLHLAGYDLFCEVCLDGREVEWQLTPGQSADYQPKRVAA